MAVEVLKQQLADLTRDYTGACEAIRQLEANVAEARARATAAEAAREAVLASLAAAEAVAGEAELWRTKYNDLRAAVEANAAEAQREGAEQFLAALDAEMDARAEMVDVDLGDAFGAGYDQAHADFCEAGPQIIARLFPTPPHKKGAGNE